MKFHTGPNHETDLTDEQILKQCKMYVAALRIADDFGCDLIGIQYQQGLKDLLPASDLVEGTLNNSDRPPVTSRDGQRVLYEGQPLVHFNEVDECAGPRRAGSPTACSGPPGSRSKRRCTTSAGPTPTAPARRRITSGCSRSAAPRRRPTSTAAGPAPKASANRRCISPTAAARCAASRSRGEIVWSRIYVEDDALAMDVGRGAAISLPREETERRWNATTPQWPIMHAVLYGVSRDQLMAKHKSNHVQVVYSNDAAAADRTLEVKAAMAHALGLNVNCCGSRQGPSR